MESKNLYIVHQKYGLKSHLIIYREGRGKAICGHEVKHKSIVTEFTPFTLSIPGPGTICQRCLDIAGFEKDGDLK